MIIINKTKTHIVNFDSVTEILMSSSCYGSIRVNFANGGRYELEHYDTEEEARIAMEMLCDSIGKSDVFVMPTSEQIHNRIISRPDSLHRYSGIKPKRHGGS